MRRKIAASNASLVQSQEGFLERSAKAAGEGRYADAQRQYKAAKALRDELVARGESAGGQVRHALRVCDSQLGLIVRATPVSQRSLITKNTKKSPMV